MTPVTLQAFHPRRHPEDSQQETGHPAVFFPYPKERRRKMQEDSGRKKQNGQKQAERRTEKTPRGVGQSKNRHRTRAPQNHHGNPKTHGKTPEKKNRKDLNGHAQLDEAIVQREHLQDTLGKCKTSGPPGTAEVSHFPAPQKVVEKQKTTTKATHHSSPVPILSVESS